DLYGQTKLAWQRFFELQSERQRDRYAGWGRYERRRGRRRVYRNGYYERDFVTRFGTIRLRVARTREKSFLPRGLQPFQRREASGDRCWWLTACGAMAGVTCWRFCAVRERVRPTGKACSRICIAAGWKASTWR